MLGFFREYLANHHDTGAIAPSSRFLARTIVREAGVRPGVSVLELGPGTGAFTGAIEAALGGEGRYLGIEINPRFHKNLREKFPTLRFELASAAEFDLAAEEEAWGPFDAVVSGLPWAGFEPGLQGAILGNVLPRIRPGGKFATFAYTGPHLREPGRNFRRLLGERFTSVRRTRTVVLNLPPAFVYVATR
jgi:phospholipid N-methyltransferase